MFSIHDIFPTQLYLLSYDKIGPCPTLLQWSIYPATYEYFFELDFKLFHLYNSINENAVNILTTLRFLIVSYANLM
jgi:hypothetical protein